MDTEFKDYVKRITAASPLELIIINYELIIKSTEEAKESSSHEPSFERHLNRAKGFLNELASSLDLKNPVAKELMPIYLYVNKLLIQAGITRDIEKRKAFLGDVTKILNILLGGWKEIPKEQTPFSDTAGKFPKVYAGLTYGKNGELEEYSTDLEDRGKKI